MPRRRPTGQRLGGYRRGGDRVGGGGGLSRPRAGAAGPRNRPRRGRGDDHQARTELHRALDCKKPYGHAAQPWTTWAILEQLEDATGHPDAAHTARHQAIASYLAYRQAGGGSESDAIGMFDHVARAITEHTPVQAARDLATLLQPDTAPRIIALVQALQALLAGDPEPARTDHPDLEPRDVAELSLLLAALDEPPPGTTGG